MFYFPKRPIDRRGFYRRRSFQSDIHRYEDVVAHYDMGQCCYVDTERQVPCAPGDSIEAVADLGQYGYHCSNAGAARYPFVIDNGVAAVQTTNSTTISLQTAVAFQAAMQIVVFRSAGAAWNAYGSVFGGVGANNASTRWYLFNNSNTGFFINPSTVQRQNGLTMTVGAALANIATPMVLTLGHSNPAVSVQRIIGREQTQANSLFIYEILAFSSILPIEDIEQIEAYLMDKYGIAGGS